MTGNEFMMIAAATLPNLLSMIAMFRAENQKSDDLTLSEFSEWLSRHHHEELKKIIFQNAELSRQIEIALQEDHQVIMRQLDVVAKGVSSIALKLSAFENLARVTTSQSELTDQACMLLCKAAKNPVFPQITIAGPNGFPPVPVIGRGIEVPEPYDVLDDLQALEHYGFLATAGYGTNGHPHYRVTREGRRFAQMLEKDQQSEGPLSAGPLTSYKIRMKVADPRAWKYHSELRDKVEMILLKVGLPEFETKGATLLCEIKCTPLDNDILESLKKVVSDHGFSLQAEMLTVGL